MPPQMRSGSLSGMQFKLDVSLGVIVYAVSRCDALAASSQRIRALTTITIRGQRRLTVGSQLVPFAAPLQNRNRHYESHTEAY